LALAPGPVSPENVVVLQFGAGASSETSKLLLRQSFLPGELHR
jgi:hypothetical protein